MKLRIRGASLRLRLTQKEIQSLLEGGWVQEQVPFGGGVQLTYRLERDRAAKDIHASLENGVITIAVPEALAHEWCTTQLVTLSREQPTGQGALRITLEKDFACLAPRSDEDESDSFPHPDGASGRTC